MTGGSDTATSSVPPNPAPEWLPAHTWTLLCRTGQLPQLQTLPASFSASPAEWRAVFDSPRPFGHPFPEPWEDVDPLLRLTVVRLLRPDRLLPALRQYVAVSLGSGFTQPPLLDLPSVYSRSKAPWVPFIFVLSPGVEPLAELTAFAETMGMSSRFESLSLGQGMGKRAAELILSGRQQGLWVVLQNCHVFLDWMPSLDRAVADYGRPDARAGVHNNFRLWLTAMPSPKLPLGLLQGGVKLVVEAPRGLRANLLRTYAAEPLSQAKFLESTKRPDEWKTYVFALCFFHAVVQV